MLDYTQREKKFLSVKLADGKIILLSPPKKAAYSRLISLEEKFNNTEGYESFYDEILELTADILSCNKVKKKYTPEMVDELMDIEDMSLLITEYGKFTTEIMKSPN